jgi:K+-sensing histidine kinase KdpD
MSFIKNFFKKIWQNHYFKLKKIPKNIKILLADSDITLFYLDIEKLEILNCDTEHDFKNAIMYDDDFKKCFYDIKNSFDIPQKIIQMSVNVNKQYYKVSLYNHKKNPWFKNNNNHIVMCLIKNITERVKTHHTIYNAYQEQLRMNKMKTAFLSRMSHEFRTPLNAVIGFSDAIKHKLYGSVSEPYLEYIDNIHAAGNHLLDIVNDIMDVSYSENNVLHLNLTDFSPIAAIENILNFIHSLLTRQKIIVKLSHNLPDNYKIHNDLNVFKRIFINILGNATKYCPYYTQLDIKILLLSDSELSLSIKDYGHGFPQSVIDNFGTPFNVGDNFLTDTNKSIGLGLSIVKSSIYAMNGTISINNHSESGVVSGAVIDIVIPINLSIASHNYLNESDKITKQA